MAIRATTIACSRFVPDEPMPGLTGSHGAAKDRVMTQTASQPTPSATGDAEALVTSLARAARLAQRQLAAMSSAARAAALRLAADRLEVDTPAILAANAQDLAVGEANGLAKAMLDRLALDEARLAGIAAAVRAWPRPGASTAPSWRSP